MIRPNELVLPLLRETFPKVAVLSQVPDVDHRHYPIILVRPAGGTDSEFPEMLGYSVIEMSAHSATDLADAETLYLNARMALVGACRRQSVIAGKGWLHSVKQTMGATQLEPIFGDTWRVLGLIRLGLRPINTTLGV
jgi:hypothetical protein